MKNFRNILLFILVLSIFGCKGGENGCHQCPPSTPTTPETCTITVSPQSQNFAAAGGTGTITITKSSAACSTCSATTSSVNWIVINSNTGYTVSPNTGGARSATVNACGTTITVTQEPATPTQSCTYSSQSSYNFSWEGRSFPIVVFTQSGCPSCTTAPTGLPSWLTVVSTGGGNFTGTVTNNTDSNNSRTVTFTLCGVVITVYQGPAPTQPTCNFTVSPSSLRFPCQGDTKTVTVTTGAGCSWFATSNMSGITVNRDHEWISGSGTVTVTATGNGNYERNGTITVAGQGVAITQDACPIITPPTGCTIDASATFTASKTCPSGTVYATGYGTGRATSSTCADAKTQADAQAMTNAVADANAKLAATSCPVVTPTCNYAVPPSTPTFSCQSGNGSIDIGATAGCTWSASTTTPDMISITGGASGSGNGAVRFAVSSDSGSAARTGRIVVTTSTGTYNVSVPQSACPAPTCNYAVPPETPAFAYQDSGNGSIDIGATAGCSWSATTTTPGMISITGSASGSGNGAVHFAVAGNGGPARNGQVVVTTSTGTYNVRVPQLAHP